VKFEWRIVPQPEDLPFGSLERMILEQEALDADAAWHAHRTAWAWERWVIASCTERNGAHSWWLDWDEADGLRLGCQHCPASVDELYPDGNDSLFAELPVPGGGILRIENGMTPLTADPPVQEWHGAVRAWVEQEYYPGTPDQGEEWDAWVIVEAVTQAPGSDRQESRS
jgi:hypothetical protein